MFFDMHPEFLETSNTAADLRRLNLRHQAIFEENRSLFADARVLDLASHDGRWSFAALEQDASFVLGIEGRRPLVTSATNTLRAKGVSTSRYEFITGDLHDAMKEVGDFDVVLCLGFLYHTLRYVELFSGIRRCNPTAIVIDTAVSFGRRSIPGMSLVSRRLPLIRLATNSTKKQRAAIRDAYSVEDRTVVGIPTIAAIGYLLDAYGFRIAKETDWRLLARRFPGPRQPIRQYLAGHRRTLVATASDRHASLN